MYRNRLSLLILLLFVMGCRPKDTRKGVDSYDEYVKFYSNVIKLTGGNYYRDLNKNDKIDIYEDPSQAIEDRVEDLLRQMSLHEKAGTLFIDGAPVNTDGSLEGKIGITGPAIRRPPAIKNIDDSKMTHFNIWDVPDPSIVAGWYNRLQQYAERTRLGIPITISSDPRHHFSQNLFSVTAKGFSQFCEMLGFAAIGDDSLMHEFGDIVRRQYLAVGIRQALHPQVDLATEPRWARINGSFGADAALTARLAVAYIKGMQGDTLDSNSVSCMTKHFPGGGPQKEGLDPHFSLQKGQVYPGDNFNYHLIPFEAAIKANTAAIMPYYGIPIDQTDENVAMAYNKSIITGLLREKYDYQGVVCTDWGLITDVPIPNTDIVWPARAWGVEHLSPKERVLKILQAGCDQFGGESREDLVIALVEEGILSEDRIDESVRKLLRLKFQQGIFDNPFLDTTKVSDILNKQYYWDLGEQTQQKAMTLLKNEDDILPLGKSKLKVYIENMDATVVQEYVEVVSSVSEANLAIVRLHTPWYPAESPNPYVKGFHHGDLNFKGKEKERLIKLLDRVPTVVDIYLDRPAVIPEIASKAKALIANYGASDRSVCEVLFGAARPLGKLPFELPSSMTAVEDQLTDVPYDSKDPLFEFGFGLSYSR